MTSTAKLEWHPGSFTKNFGWGTEERGLSELHSIIRIGFDGEVVDTPRAKFRERVQAAGKIDYVPINFFLFNHRGPTGDMLVADELVFQAVTFRHSRRFDKLALFAFNLSMAGSWKGATADQRYPALWSHYYVTDRVAADLNWDMTHVVADDIERFVLGDARYAGKTGRKLATNLAYLFRLGRLSEFAIRSVEQWWVDCVFLAMDRIWLDRREFQEAYDETKLSEYLWASDFGALSGKRSTEKDLAVPHLLDLYRACGGHQRFSPTDVAARTALLLPDVAEYLANDPQPIAAIHRSNPSIVKALPRACAMLARYAAHFETILWADLESFDVEGFVRKNLDEALGEIEANSKLSNMSAEEYLKLLRDED